jgi:hypothetical protein
MRSIHLIRLFASLAVVAGLSVSVAAAAPTNAPGAEPFPLECNNGVTYTVVVYGRGDFTPAHVIDGDGRVLKPVAFTFVVTDSAGNILSTDSIAKPGQMQGLAEDLIVCTFTETFEDNGETITATGSVTLFVAPRN